MPFVRVDSSKRVINFRGRFGTSKNPIGVQLVPDNWIGSRSQTLARKFVGFIWVNELFTSARRGPVKACLFQV